MGRQQVQPALRQAVQQQTANPKVQQQQKPAQQKQQQQQSKQQQSRPKTAATPVANTATSRPESAASQSQTQVKQQPKQQAQSQQLKSNGQVYRPTPVKEHPDDAFLSGAWMFDQSRVPQWMSSQLPTQQRSVASKSAQQQQPKLMKQQQQQPVSRPTSSSPTPTKQQLNKNTINAQVYRPSPVKEHVDDAFNSGAWLFDESRVPQWMAPHLPKMQQRSATPKSAQPRPSSVPTQHQQAAKPAAVQQKQAQPVMQQQRQQPTQPKQQQKQSPSMQHGDDAFLWNGWSQTSRQPLWTNSNTSSTKPATMNAAARPQSPPAKQAQQQQSQGRKRPQSPARR